MAVGRGLPTEEGQVSKPIAPAPVVVQTKAPPVSGTGPDPVPESSTPGSKSETAPPEPIAGMDPRPTGFVFLGGKLYVADIESGLLVYEPDGGVEDRLRRYTLKSKHGPPNLAWVTGRLVAAKPILYGTDGSRLLQFSLDGAGFRSIELARAGPNQVFRGVAFVPTVLDEPMIPFVVALAISSLVLVTSAVTILAIRRNARRRVRFDGTDILVEGGPIDAA